MVKIDIEKFAKYAKKKRNILLYENTDNINGTMNMSDILIISQIGRRSYGMMSKTNLEYIAKESGVEAALDFIEKELDKAEVK